MKVGSFSFGSPVSAPSVSNPIFDIKETEYKNNISIPIFYGSVKKNPSFGSMAASVFPKTSGGGFSAYYSTNRPRGFKFGSSTEVSEFETFTRINTKHVSGERLIISPCHLRARQEKNCDIIC